MAAAGASGFLVGKQWLVKLVMAVVALTIIVRTLAGMGHERVEPTEPNSAATRAWNHRSQPPPTDASGWPVASGDLDKPVVKAWSPELEKEGGGGRDDGGGGGGGGGGTRGGALPRSPFVGVPSMEGFDVRPWQNAWSKPGLCSDMSVEIAGDWVVPKYKKYSNKVKIRKLEKRWGWVGVGIGGFLFCIPSGGGNE